jgi:hypothetical protein
MMISPEQLEQHKINLQIFKARIDLLEKELAAFEQRGHAERCFFVELGKANGVNMAVTTGYREAHEAHYAAEKDLKTLALAEVKRDYNVGLALLEEANKTIATPGRGKVSLT